MMLIIHLALAVMVHLVFTIDMEWKRSLTTFSDYFILGVPRYEDALVEFYLATLDVQPFEVQVKVKRSIDVQAKSVVHTSTVVVGKFELSSYTLNVNDVTDDSISSIVFKSDRQLYKFCVTVVFTDVRTGLWIDSFLATPASMFYYFFMMPLMTTTEVRIIILSYHDQIKAFVEDAALRITVNLFKEEAAVVSAFCGNRTIYGQHGVVINSGHPIGVILASCDLPKCSEKVNGFLASSAILDNTYNEYIIFSRLGPVFSSEPSVKDEVKIMSNLADAQLIINREIYMTVYDGRYVTISVDGDKPLFVESSRPVMCYYISKSIDCSWAISASLVLPSDSFIFSYSISVPFPYNSISSASTAHLIIVALEDRISKILLDDNYILNYETTVTKVNKTQYQVRYLQISTGLHYSYSEDVSNYGLYLFGRKDFGTYFHPVGFKDSKMDLTEQGGSFACNEFIRVELMHPGDMMDNDCDGKIDEEMPGSDVDSDNQISEDLRRGVAVHGVWEQWERWGCDDECTGKFMTRRRYCYQPLPFYEGAPCQGHDLETKDTPCMSDRCVEDVCPPGFYGRACEHQCQNCAGFCNRRDGTCPLCRPGWIGFHCDVACPPMTYGLECQHSCSKKCNGKDCIDRVFGYCQPAMDLIAFMVVYYLLLSIVLSGLCYLMFCYTVEKIERTEIVTVKRVSSKEFTLTKQVYEHC